MEPSISVSVLGAVHRDGDDPDCEPRDSHCGPELCEQGSVTLSFWARPAPGEALQSWGARSQHPIPLYFPAAKCECCNLRGDDNAHSTGCFQASHAKPAALSDVRETEGDKWEGSEAPAPFSRQSVRQAHPGEQEAGVS